VEPEYHQPGRRGEADLDDSERILRPYATCMRDADAPRIRPALCRIFEPLAELTHLRAAAWN
jgi:hypothetical protein